MRIATLVKTGDGPLWIIPQVLAERAAGDEVVVLLPAPHHADSRVARELAALGVEVVESPAPLRGGSPLAQLAGIRRLRTLLRALDVDVVHYHLYASALAARLATLGTRITRVHMVAGPLYLDNGLIRRVERVLCRLDHMLIASSGDIAARYTALGVPAHRLRTLSYGVDLARFTRADEKRRTRARAEFDLPADEFVAVCVAYFYPPKRLVRPGQGVKGHEVLLAAWARFVERGGEGTLILLGGGYGEAGEQYRDRLRAWSATLPGADRIRWVESVTDVSPYYAAADVNVVSSWSESYGAGGEASACGVPSVSTAAGGLPELVDPETGWLVSLGDAAGLADGLRDAAAGRGGDAARQRSAAARLRAERLLDRRALSHEVVAALHDAAHDRRPWWGRLSEAAEAIPARPPRVRSGGVWSGGVWSGGVWSGGARSGGVWSGRSGRGAAAYPGPGPAGAAPGRSGPASPAVGLAGFVRSPAAPALPARLLRAARRTWLLRTDPVRYARGTGGLSPQRKREVFLQRHGAALDTEVDQRPSVLSSFAR